MLYEEVRIFWLNQSLSSYDLSEAACELAQKNVTPITHPSQVTQVTQVTQASLKSPLLQPTKSANIQK